MKIEYYECDWCYRRQESKPEVKLSGFAMPGEDGKPLVAFTEHEFCSRVCLLKFAKKCLEREPTPW